MNSCYRCGRHENLHKDRIIPGIEGGTYTPDNIRYSCQDCHQYRHKREQIINAIEKELVDYTNINRNERLRIFRKRLSVIDEENTPGKIRERGYFPYFNVYNERVPIRKVVKSEVG